MSKFSFLPAAAAAFAASLLAPSGASADVYVYRPRPIIVAPPPPPPPPHAYYVAPAAPVCTTRFVGVWINGVYTHRAVRACY